VKGLPRFKGVPRISTIQQTAEHRYEFGYADLVRLLRLPEGTQLTVETPNEAGALADRSTVELRADCALVATVVVSS
jgi:hypothetical protein